MPKIETCILGLEDVIFDTSSYHFAAWEQIASDLNIDISSEQIASLLEQQPNDAFEKILEWGNLFFTLDQKQHWVNTFNVLSDEYMQNVHQETMKNGVLQLIKAIYEKRIPLFLVTTRPNAKEIVENLQLNHFFNDILTVAHKTDLQAAYLDIINKQSLPSKEIVIIDAQIEAIQVGLSLGVFTIGIGDMKTLKKAHLVIDSYEDLTFEEMLSCLY